MIHLDSSLLIDLLRETARERPGSAFAAMEALDAGEILAVSVHVVCELRAGAELAKRPLREIEVLDLLFAGVLVAYPDDRFAPLYARLFAAIHRTSHKSAKPLPSMDLLIATAALLDDAPIMTRNVKGFSRVPGLRVVGY